MADTTTLVAPRNESLPTLGIHAKKGQEYPIPSGVVDELTGRGWTAPKKPTPPTKASADKKEA